MMWIVIGIMAAVLCVMFLLCEIMAGMLYRRLEKIKKYDVERGGVQSGN